MLRALAHPVYRRLFLAQVVALAGTGLATVALGLLAYDLAGERAGVVVSRIATRRGQALRTSLWRAEEDGWVLAHRQDTPTA